LASAHYVIGESLVVATNSTSATFNYNVPGGTLDVGAIASTIANLDVGTRSGTAADVANVGILNLSGSANFNATVDRVRIGVLIADPPNDQNTRGTVTLPTTSNITVGTEVMISDSFGDALSGHPSLLTFGAGNNTLIAPVVTVGGRKGNGNLNIAPGGTLIYSGFGEGTGDLFIARNFQDNTGATTSGNFNFTDGTLLAELDEIVIGLKSGPAGGVGGATGVFTLGSAAHVITANWLRLGDSNSGSSGTTIGTLNLGGGTFAVANDVSLGIRTGTGGVGSGVLNLTGGTFTVGGNIVTTDSASANATLTLDGATLNMTSGSISADTLNVRSGTLQNVAEIFGGDGTTPAPVITKSTAGQLILAGTNSYTGLTDITAGTVLVTGSLTGSDVQVAAGTLGGNGSITQEVTVFPGSILAPGPTVGTIGTLASGPLSMFAASNFALEIDSTATTSDLLAITGGLDLDPGNAVTLTITDLAPAAITNGIFPFITYTTWNGGFFTVNGEVIDQVETFFVSGNEYRLDYDLGGNTVAMVAVPEPGTIASLLGGLGLLVGLGRARRRK
jgi:fibronectin-binding autotransporter adhesin